MKKQTRKQKQKVNDFDQMADMLLGHVEYVQCLFPEQFPKLLVLLEAIETGQIDECSGADLRQLLRDFKLTADFSADVAKFIGVVRAAHQSAAFQAHLEALAQNDPIRLKAKKFVDLYGESGTWAQMEAILAE